MCGASEFPCAREIFEARDAQMGERFCGEAIAHAPFITRVFPPLDKATHKERSERSGGVYPAYPVHLAACGSTLICDDGERLKAPLPQVTGKLALAELFYNRISLFGRAEFDLLYGEMVPDTRLNFSICSGDTIATFLARKFSAEKICFASDIDGIFTEDPHRFPDASLIEHLDFDQLGARSGITGSHSVDVTGGLGGKLEKLAPLHHSSVESVEIFNGLKAEHYRNILLDIPFPHTIIRF
jgi:hypothetical protein